ncbi:MAG: hypothetical protein WBQ03_04475 [Candidatus Sulfotelmatobacter sp.]
MTDLATPCAAAHWEDFHPFREWQVRAHDQRGALGVFADHLKQTFRPHVSKGHVAPFIPQNCPIDSFYLNGPPVAALQQAAPR